MVWSFICFLYVVFYFYCWKRILCWQRWNWKGDTLHIYNGIVQISYLVDGLSINVIVQGRFFILLYNVYKFYDRKEVFHVCLDCVNSAKIAFSIAIFSALREDCVKHITLWNCLSFCCLFFCHPCPWLWSCKLLPLTLKF